MNLVIDYSNNHHIQGISSTLVYSKINFMTWNSSKTSPHDMFYSQKPDYLIVLSENISSALLDISRKKNIEVWAIGSKRSEKSIQHLELGELCNPVQYGGGKYNIKYNSDITLFTNPNIDIYTVDKLINMKNKVKIWGDFPIDRPQYLGKLKTHKERSDAIKSCRLFLDSDCTNRLNALLLGVPCCPLYFFPAKVLNNDKQEALSNTYFHIVSDLLSKMGQKQLSEQVINKWNVLLSQLL